MKNIDFSKTIYYKEDRPPKKGEPFTDPYFPPNENSLLGKNEKGEFLDKREGKEKASRIPSNNIEWRRASEIFKGKKYFLFEDVIEMDDILQGQLGDCYFLSSVAALAEFPYLIYNMFRTKEINKEGYFEVVLYVDGRFQVVIVDDYLPYGKKSKGIIYAKPRRNEIWVCILEKAWAKINGGYSNIISGWMRQALQAFTGFGNSSFTHAKTDSQRLWRELEYAEQNDCLMTGSSAKNIESLGLVSSHAYTIPKVIKITSNGEKIKLVKLRNTWGYKEWKGDWSDGSDKWGPEELAQVQEYKNADDGSFFMTFDEYFKKYVITDICYLQYNCHSKSFCIDPSTGMHQKGIVINIALPEDGFITFSLMRKMWRYNRELRGTSIPSMIAVFKINIDEGNSIVEEFDGVYEGYEDISINKVLKAGLYVVYAFRDFSQYKHDPDINYIIKIDSPVDFRYKVMPPDEPEKGLPYLQSALLRYLSKQKEFVMKKDKIVLTVNELGRSGLSARIFYNDSPTKVLHVTCTNRAPGLNVVFNYPKNQDGNYDLYIEPNFYGVIIGIRKEQYTTGTYSTKNKLTYLKENPCPTNFDITQYEDYNLIREDIGDPKTYYDRTSMTREQASECKKFEQLKGHECKETDIQEAEPKFYEMIKQMKEPTNNKYLRWGNMKTAKGEYIGQINRDGKKEGRGILIEKDKYIIGYWKDDQVDGEAKEYSKLEDKLVYEGHFKDGLKDGKGKFYYVNGDIFEGNFSKGKMSGMGKHTFSKNNTTWEGNYDDGKMNGQGTYTNAKGQKSLVTYINGKLAKSAAKPEGNKLRSRPHGSIIIEIGTRRKEEEEDEDEQQIEDEDEQQIEDEDEPHENRPHGNRPHGNRPHGGRPHGNRPHGEPVLSLLSQIK